MDQLLQSLLGFLKEAVCTILFAFGVIYAWLSLANPDAQIEVGVGGCIGAVGFVLGPWSGAAGIAVGGLLGSFIGSGV